MLEETLPVSLRDPARGQCSRTRVQNQSVVWHYDVLDYDLHSYAAPHQMPIPGQLLGLIRCYAQYDPVYKQILLVSFPGQPQSVKNNLTHAIAKHCRVVGNLFDDFDLLQELRRAEQGEPRRFSESPLFPRYQIHVRYTLRGYTATAVDYPVRVSGKDLHYLLDNMCEKLDSYLSRTQGLMATRHQLEFIMA